MKNNVTYFMVLILAILLFPVVSYTAVKEIISEGTYNMGDGETPTVAESRALLQAKRTALEQAGTYVESYSRVKNFQLTEDEIQVLASGVMEVSVMEKKRTVVGDLIHFWVKIKSKVSTDKIEELKNRVKEKSVVEDYKRIQEAYDKSQKENEELKKQMAAAKNVKGKGKIEIKIAEEERKFRANEWADKGRLFLLNKEYDKSIESYTSAITLTPNYDRAYFYRGFAYGNKGQFDRAIEDLSEAIAINPNNDESYYITRGLVYGRKDQHDRAIEDCNKAIAINPNNAFAYGVRGVAYYYKGIVERAVSDFQKACNMDDKLGWCEMLEEVRKKK